MKQTFIILMLCSVCIAQAQTNTELPLVASSFSINAAPVSPIKEIRLSDSKWRLNRNHIATGSLVFLAGIAKGFNETLQFHWKEFHRQFPNANPQWYSPSVSWTNKYKNGDPNAGPKYFMSTSLLIMFTDQYHLNNFINRMAWGSALVIKIGEGKKPFKQYLFDFLYYAACHQAGFALSYYPFSKFKGK
jgi:hypothetical protein